MPPWEVVEAPSKEAQGCRVDGQALKQTLLPLILPAFIYTAVLTPDIFMNFDVFGGIRKTH